MADFDLSESDEFDFDSDVDLGEEDKHTSDEFKITNVKNVERYMWLLTDRTASLLSVDKGTSQLFLNGLQWNLGEATSMFVEDPDLLARKSGLKSSKDFALLKPKLVCGSGADLGQGKASAGSSSSRRKNKSVPKNASCPICSELKTDWMSLGCSHSVCSDCFALHIRINMLENRKVFSTKCPGSYECPLIVTRDAVEVLAEAESLKKFDSLVLQRFINCHPDKYRHCPHPGCEALAEKVLDGSSKAPCSPVNCSCGREFCFNCGASVNHFAVPCDIANKWLALVDHEHRSSMWILQNTKQCPQCHTKIQRSEGCNHMSCGNCKYEFCWVCSESWAEHSGKSYYNCVKFNPSESATGNMSLSKKQKERLNFYMFRYDNHASLAELVDDSVAKEAHTLLAWGYVLLNCILHNNFKLILEDLMTDLVREVEEMSPWLKQRTLAVAEFVRSTSWMINQTVSLQA